MSQKPHIRALNGICKVKNASLFFDYEKGIYHLVHYDTEILTLASTPDNVPTILKALKCSNSSTRAIYQVTDFLNIPRDKVRLQKYDKFVKYNMSTEIRKTKSQLSEVIEQ